MKQFRYAPAAGWLKGNVHIHSVASDGGKTFAELSGLYAGAGYDFLFRTDHWAASNIAADTEEHPLLWLDGVELDGMDETGALFHVVCLGFVEGLDRDMGLEAALESARRQGAFTILAHPHWCGNSTEDCLRWPFDGVEIYNHVCRWLNGKSGGLVHWDAMLNSNGEALAFAVDDAHLRPQHPGWNGGWIMVQAAAKTRESIMEAIRAGRFYSTQGPEIHSIEWDGAELHLALSPVRFVRLAGPRSRGARLGSFDGEEITEVRMPVNTEWKYVYLEIEDAVGRRAWTNTLFRNGESAG